MEWFQSELCLICHQADPGPFPKPSSSTPARGRGGFICSASSVGYNYSWMLYFIHFLSFLMKSVSTIKMYHLNLFLPLSDVFFLRVTALPYCKETQKEEWHLNTNPLFIFWGKDRRKTDKCRTQIYPTNNSICIKQNNSHPDSVTVSTRSACHFFWINTAHQKIDFFFVLTENCTTKNAGTY